MHASGGLSRAEIIGISVGVVVAAITLTGMTGWVWRLHAHRRRPGSLGKNESKLDTEKGQDAGVAELGVEKDEILHEMDNDTSRAEIDGSSIMIHEAPEERLCAELPERRFSHTTEIGTIETGTTGSHTRQEEEMRESPGDSLSKSSSSIDGV